jgi:hypothetical protein
MSMLHLFRKYIDWVEYRKVEDEKKRKLEVKAPASDDDLVAEVALPPDSRRAPLLTCRARWAERSYPRLSAVATVRGSGGSPTW